MTLWIRTQDRKSLFEENTFEIQDIKKMMGVVYLDKEELEKENKRFIITNGVTTLGSYDTEERCLEILDEIQKILEPQKIIKTIDNTVKIENAIHIVNPTYETITQFDTYVYEMPEV